MLEENKKANPLDSNLPNPTDPSDPSDPTFTYQSENNTPWTLEHSLNAMGSLIIIVGFFGSLILGLSLETVKSYSMIDATYNAPHPMRWIYAGVTFLSALFSAFIMFGLAEILKRLDNLKLDTVRE